MVRAEERMGLPSSFLNRRYVGALCEMVVWSNGEVVKNSRWSVLYVQS